MKARAPLLSLWRNDVLALPRALMDAYHRRLVSLGVPHAYADRRARFGAGQVGGGSDTETTAHFALNFAGGAARPLFVYLDPRDRFAAAGATLRTLTLEGRLCLIDAPSGAGTASLALLAAIADLRASRVLPTTPLDVHLVHADISQLGLRLAEQTMNELRPRLEALAIEVNYESLIWDASSHDDVESLARRARASGCPIAMIVVGAFSEAFKQSWHSHYEWLAASVGADGMPCALVWIEAAPPQSKKYPAVHWLTTWASKLSTAAARAGLTAAPSASIVAESFRAVDPIELPPTPFDAHVTAHAFFNKMWRS